MAMVMYEVLAHAPGQVPVLWSTVATEAFAQGMADAAFLTYLSGPLLAGIHRHALRIAVLDPGACDPHDRRIFRRAGRSGRLGGILRDLHLCGVAGDGADGAAVAALPGRGKARPGLSVRWAGSASARYSSTRSARRLVPLLCPPARTCPNRQQ